LLFVAACGVRTPARIDLTALVGERGAVEARRALVIRVLDDPRDVQARLALAELVEQSRPSEAIEQLEAVERLGGPIGTRWRLEDQQRLARLLRARGHARSARGAASALADLERAKALGIAPSSQDLEYARYLVAVAQLRHVAVRERASGRQVLAELVNAHDIKAVPGFATWVGARATATPAERGAFGAWLWTVGARREAYEQLAAWHAATRPPRDEALQAAYLRALAWWSPLWLGEVKPPPAEDLVGPERCWFPGADCVPPAPEETPLPEPAALDAEPRAAVAARYAAARSSVDVKALLPIATAFHRDPAIAERLGRDLVAANVDAAIAHAALGALFDALGDPGRARAAWQAAAAGSAEPAFVRGLAEATARGGDGAAALVFATQAAAAWGDPAVVWAAVADALLASGQYVDALAAARSAIDLAGPEVLPRALDVAIAASRGLRRNAQADALLVQRAQLGPRSKTADADAQAALVAHREQPTASTIASLWVASRAHPRDIELRAALIDALDADDPRRATVTAELVTLAADPDQDRAFAAVSALRR
jgi:hypothetical protein